MRFKRVRLSILVLFLLIIASGSIQSMQNPDTSNTEIKSSEIITQQSQDWYVVDFAGVADYRFWDIYGNQTRSVIQQSINDTNTYLKNSGIPLSFRLMELVVFKNASTANSTFTYESTGDGEVDPTKLLESFDTYFQNDATLSTYEDGELFTGFDLTDNTFGIAYKGINDQLLTREEAHKGTGVVQGTIQDTDLIGVITAHELGHSFSAGHDGIDNSCSDTGFIMTVQLSQPFPDTYSDCTASKFETHLGLYFDTFIDSTLPTASYLNSTTNFAAESSPIELGYSTSDSHLRNYEVYINGTLNGGQRLDGTDVEFVYDFYPDAAGTWNVTVVVYDYAYQSVTVTVQLNITESTSPIVSSPSDIDMNEGEAQLISWHASDLELWKAILYQNGSAIKNYTLNAEDADIEYDLSTQSFGTYNYTIMVFDTANNSASDTVIVDIAKNMMTTTSSDTSENNTTADTTTKQTTSESTSSEDSEIIDNTTFNPIEIIGGHYFVIALLSLGLTIAVRRYKSRN